MYSFYNIIDAIDSYANESESGMVVQAMVENTAPEFNGYTENMGHATDFDETSDIESIREAHLLMMRTISEEVKAVNNVVFRNLNTVHDDSDSEELGSPEEICHPTDDAPDIESIRDDQIQTIETIRKEVEAVNDFVFRNMMESFEAGQMLRRAATTTTEEDVYFVEWFSRMKTSGDPSAEVASILLDGGANVNLQDRNGWTALMVASHLGYTDIVKLLLGRGADVNLKNRNGESALMRAIVAGAVEVVTMLLGEGSDVDLPTKDGWSALMFACQNGGETGIVQQLLDRGVNVNHQTKDGISALMIACDRNCSKIVKMLLDKGADANLQNKGGESAVMIAKELAHPETVKLLLDKVSLATPGLVGCKNRAL